MQKIMFNDKYGLTQAVLVGRKTMTRRLAEKVLVEGENGELHWNGEFKPSRYKVGEVVAVAQNYGEVFDEFAEKFYTTEDPITPNFENFGRQNDDLMKTAGWTNKMFVKAELMPHRIRFTGLRVERLQDISDEDCLREGVMAESIFGDNDYCTVPGIPHAAFASPREAFAALIDKVSGKGTFGNNPWVFVYEFELVK